MPSVEKGDKMIMSSFGEAPVSEDFIDPMIVKMLTEQTAQNSKQQDPTIDQQQKRHSAADNNGDIEEPEIIHAAAALTVRHGAYQASPGLAHQRSNSFRKACLVESPQSSAKTLPNHDEQDVSPAAQQQDADDDDSSTSRRRRRTSSLVHLVEAHKVDAIVEAEAKVLWWTPQRISCCVLGFLILMSVLFATVVYFNTKHHERANFEEKFAMYADKFADSFYESIERRLGNVHALSATITSYAAYTNASFPFVTLPDFEVLGGNARINSDATLMYWLPLVTDDTRDEWEQYADQNRHHIDSAFLQDLEFKATQDAKFGLLPEEQQQEDDDDEGNVDDENEEISEGNETTSEAPKVEYSYEIFGTEGRRQPRPRGLGRYLPLWQLTPVLPIMTTLNFDLLSHIAVQDDLNAVLDSEHWVMGQIHNNYDPKDENNESRDLYNAFLSMGQYRHNMEIYRNDPSTSLVYPVFDSHGPNNRTLAGIIFCSVYWRLDFANVLPEGAKGLMAVLSNSREQTFTYRIDGPNVTFLGPGDRHDPKYDSLALIDDVTAHVQKRSSPENQCYGEANLHANYCRLSLHIYPSQDTEDMFMTRQPLVFLVFTLVIVGIFGIASFVFIGQKFFFVCRSDSNDKGANNGESSETADSSCSESAAEVDAGTFLNAQL